MGKHRKYKKQILYLIFGAATTAINLGVSSLLFYCFQFSTVLSNVISELCAITFAFFTNKTIVFGDKKTGKSAIYSALLFYGGRIVAVGVSVGLMKLCVDIAGFNFIISKCSVTVLVIIANYFYSEYIVFKKNRSDETENGATPPEKTEKTFENADNNLPPDDNKDITNK